MSFEQFVSSDQGERQLMGGQEVVTSIQEGILYILPDGTPTNDFEVSRGARTEKYGFGDTNYRGKNNSLN